MHDVKSWHNLAVPGKAATVWNMYIIEVSGDQKLEQERVLEWAVPKPTKGYHISLHIRFCDG